MVSPGRWIRLDVKKKTLEERMSVYVYMFVGGDEVSCNYHSKGGQA